MQVSPVDSTGTCTIISRGPSGTSPADLAVTVDCYNTAGTLTDETFDVLVTQPHSASSPHGVLDYDWIFTGAHGKLNGFGKQFQFNSSHKVNSVSRPHTGVYVVTMPGPGPSGVSKGTIHVSPYGPGGGSCQVVTSRAMSSGEQITVGCFSATGVPQNRQFTVVYARGNNLMGQNGKLDANATAAGTKALYQPTVQFDSKAGARVSVAHLDRGLYEVLFVGTNPTHHFSGGFGHIQLTPVGAALRHCGVALIPTHTPFALVGCSNAGGAPVNTSFIVQLVFN